MKPKWSQVVGGRLMKPVWSHMMDLAAIKTLIISLCKLFFLACCLLLYWGLIKYILSYLILSWSLSGTPWMLSIKDCLKVCVVIPLEQLSCLTPLSLMATNHVRPFRAAMSTFAFRCFVWTSYFQGDAGLYRWCTWEICCMWSKYDVQCVF